MMGQSDVGFASVKNVRKDWRVLDYFTTVEKANVKESWRRRVIGRSRYRAGCLAWRYDAVQAELEGALHFEAAVTSFVLYEPGYLVISTKMMYDYRRSPGQKTDIIVTFRYIIHSSVRGDCPTKTTPPSKLLVPHLSSNSPRNVKRNFGCSQISKKATSIAKSSLPKRKV